MLITVTVRSAMRAAAVIITAESRVEGAVLSPVEAAVVALAVVVEAAVVEAAVVSAGADILFTSVNPIVRISIPV